MSSWLDQLPPRLGRVGCPGEVLCVGEDAQPLYVASDHGSSSTAVAAAAALGSGRLAALAHEGYLVDHQRADIEGRSQALKSGLQQRGPAGFLSVHGACLMVLLALSTVLTDTCSCTWPRPRAKPSGSPWV